MKSNKMPNISNTVFIRYIKNSVHCWLLCLLPARRYASAGYRDRNVSVCPSVRHALVLCQNEES